MARARKGVAMTALTVRRCEVIRTTLTARGGCKFDWSLKRISSRIASPGQMAFLETEFLSEVDPWVDMFVVN